MSADSHFLQLCKVKKVLFNTRSKGGSICGVVPVGKGWNVEYMNIGYNGGSHCTLSSSKYYCDVSTTPSTALITETDGSKTAHMTMAIILPVIVKPFARCLMPVFLT